MKNLFLGFLMTVAFVQSAFAANYYVDYSAGSDSNAGTSTGAAFKTCTNLEAINFLQPGDNLHIQSDTTISGSDAHCILKSAGSAVLPITVDIYGTNPKATFDPSVDPSVDVPSWGSWVLHDGTNHIWKSNVTIPWVPEVVVVDGTSTVAKLWTSNQNLTMMQTIKARFYMSGINQLMYIRMADDSDPNGHTFRFGRYVNAFDGVVGTDPQYGKYINFNNLIVQGSNFFGFVSLGQYVNFTNAIGQYNAREGFYFAKQGATNGTGAAHNTCVNCLSQWNNTYGESGGSGQGITMEAPYVDLYDTTSQFNWMAGIDWLDYSDNTDVHHCRCIRCVSHDNSMRAFYADGNGFDPSSGYIDGAHNIQIIDSIFYNSLSLWSTSSPNALPQFAFGTEHPSTKPAYDIDVINTVMYGAQYLNVSSGAINCSGSACNVIHGIRIIGSTLKTNTNGNFSFANLGGTTGTFITFKNDIFYNAGAGANSPFGVLNTSRTISDYNVWFNSGSNIMLSTTLSAWQSASGQDAHSLFSNPLFTSIYYLNQIASGQGSDSPALAIGLVDPTAGQYLYSSLGSTRTDDVVDPGTPPNLGYHHAAGYSSSTFSSSQKGTDYL